ncbi:MAG: CCA tRNA nucleotidyltransferase [Candidatus Nitrosocaldus sp.]
MMGYHMQPSELDDVIREAYRLVEPSKADRARIDSIAGIYLKRVKDIAVEYGREVRDVILVGSYAKDTWLAESVDLDIFLKVRPDVDEERLERIAMDIGLRSLHGHNPYLRYAQHPYVEARVDGVRVNVVPCYDVEIGKWRSAADRSPYHTEYMLNTLDDAKRREVRLLKRFMKVIGVYGAEIAVQGFSGYVCEVLILRYGSFLSTLENASRWREGEVIRVTVAVDDGSDSQIRGQKDMMDDSMGGSPPIIILDPVDAKRNLGLAISYESVGRFILSARNFLRKPSIDYFTYTTTAHKPSIIYQSSLGNIIIVHFKHSPRSEDIIWGQLKSSTIALARQLSINGFKVLRHTCYTDGSNAFISFMLESLSISRLMVKQGPKVFDRDNVDRFISKNMNALLWINEGDGRLLALVERRFHDAKDLLNHVMSKGLTSSGMSKGLLDDIRGNGFKIYTGDEVVVEEGEEKEGGGGGYVKAGYMSSEIASVVKKIIKYMLVNDRFAFADE